MYVAFGDESVSGQADQMVQAVEEKEEMQAADDSEGEVADEQEE
eukprot:CAMPEP_0172718902 /NCGR_PEP_ID=MMETSP1074-20121228/75194_1 /TAXON_ID=2916 /ORGANISM="Ceratium fusus, Strain PA161109" /LENGTH=43 /DNA_ID= /DNA_START= /DNA_END= /DNA_ORIENTATION=